MGKTIILRISGSDKFALVGAVEDQHSEAVGSDAGICAGAVRLDVLVESSIEGIFSSKKIVSLKKKPVVVDFTRPSAVMDHLKQCVKAKIPIVIGTTGLTPDEKQHVRQAGGKIPIVMSPNMSVGVNALFKLVSSAVKIMGDGYDLEIMEAHHRQKKDAPSGTAVRIAEILAGETGRRYPQDFNFHRQGVTGERNPREIGMQVIRGGDITGEHTVFFCGQGERLEIRHVATDRKTFADGALLAAAWLSEKKPGFYSMQDVLCMK